MIGEGLGGFTGVVRKVHGNVCELVEGKSFESCTKSLKRVLVEIQEVVGEI